MRTSSRSRPDTWETAGDRPGGRGPGAAAHSLRIGRVAGVPLEVHWSFFLLLALVAVLEIPYGLAGIGAGLVWVAALFAFVILHELAHCMVARRRGGKVLGILLLPIGGMSRMARIPEEPADEAAIAIAGPAMSFGLGALLLLVALAIGASVWPPGIVTGSWWARLGWLNVALGIFNLLPALPMDGGRVLRATLARRLPRIAATRIAAGVARVLAVGLVIAGVIWDIWLVPIGVFVYLGARREVAQALTGERTRAPGAGAAGWGGAPPGWGAPPAGWDTAPGSTYYPPPGSGMPPQPVWPPPTWPPPAWPPPTWPPPAWPPPAGGTQGGDTAQPRRTAGSTPGASENNEQSTLR